MAFEILRTLEEQVKPNHTALIVIDVQNDFCSPAGAMAKKLNVDVTRVNASIPHLNVLIEEARQAGVLVAYIRVEHSLPRMLGNKRLLRADGEDIWPVKAGSWGAEWYDKLNKPQSGELVVTKYNYDAFEDTPLDLVLKARGIKTVVITGYMAEVCVETSSRHAFVKGYYVVIPRECTDSYSEEPYRATLSVIGNFFGKVVSSAEVAAIWQLK